MQVLGKVRRPLRRLLVEQLESRQLLAIGPDLAAPVFDGELPIAASLAASQTDAQAAAAMPVMTAAVVPAGAINVKDAPYSAVGDGVHDDTAAITAAIEQAAADGGGAVYFPAGTYNALGLPLLENVYLIGAGINASLIRLTANPTDHLFKAATAATFSNGGFSEITLDGRGTTDFDGINFSAIGTLSGFSIENASFRNFRNSYFGPSAGNEINTKFVNSQFNFNSASGATVFGSVEISNSKFLANTIGLSGRITNSTITGTQIGGNIGAVNPTQFAIKSSPGQFISQVTITGCIFGNIDDMALVLDDGNTVSSNVFYGSLRGKPTSVAVYLRGAANTITANSFGTNTSTLGVLLGDFTASAETNVLTSSGHGMSDGYIVTLSNTGGALPGGLVAEQRYYVVQATTDTFQLSNTLGGAPIDLTTDGTGTSSFQDIKAGGYRDATITWSATDHLGEALPGNIAGDADIVDNSFQVNDGPGILGGPGLRHENINIDGNRFYLLDDDSGISFPNVGPFATGNNRFTANRFQLGPLVFTTFPIHVEDAGTLGNQYSSNSMSANNDNAGFMRIDVSYGSFEGNIVTNVGIGRVPYQFTHDTSARIGENQAFDREQKAVWQYQGNLHTYRLFTGTETKNFNLGGQPNILLPAGVGSDTVPANSLGVGDKIHIRTSGVLSTAANAPGNLTISAWIDNLMATSAPIVLPAGIGNATYLIDVVYTCLTSGVNSTFQMSGSVTLQMPTGSTVFDIAQISNASVNTTADKRFFVNAVFGSSNDNTLTVNNHTIDFEPGNQPTATAAQLSITTQPPANIVAGNLFGLTVHVLDEFGHIDTNYNGPVTISVVSGATGGLLHGDPTTNAVNGVATFTGLWLNEASTEGLLRVSAAGLRGAVTAPFNVVAASASRLVVTSQPNSSVIAGSNFPLVVQAQDQFGNVDPLFQGTVTVALASHPGGSSLGGTTSVTAVGGVATFSSLVLNDAGFGYSLSISATGVPTSITRPFDALPTAARGINVRDFGAVGDGVTDDSTAILAAITAANQSESGSVYFPAGTYVAQGLPINDSFYFIGAGAGVSIVRLKDNPTDHLFKAVIAPDGNFSYAGFSDLTLDGGGTTQFDGINFDAIPLGGALGEFSIDQCVIRNFRNGYFGPSRGGEFNTKMVNSVFTGNSASGATVFENPYIENCQFLGNTIGLSGRIVDAAVVNSVFGGNIGYAHPTQFGIKSTPGEFITGISITGSTFTNIDDTAVVVDDNNTITNNQFLGSTRGIATSKAVYLRGISNVVSSNTFGKATTVLGDLQGDFAASAATDLITAAAHGMSDGYEVTVSNVGGDLPGGLTTGVRYFLVNATADTFQLSKTFGGAPIDLLNGGTGTNHWRDVTSGGFRDGAITWSPTDYLGQDVQGNVAGRAVIADNTFVVGDGPGILGGPGLSHRNISVTRNTFQIVDDQSAISFPNSGPFVVTGSNSFIGNYFQLNSALVTRFPIYLQDAGALANIFNDNTLSATVDNVGFMRVDLSQGTLIGNVASGVGLGRIPYQFTKATLADVGENQAFDLNEENVWQFKSNLHPYALFASTGSSSVSLPDTLNLIAPAGDGSNSVPARTFGVGDQIAIHAGGTLSTAAANPGTLILRAWIEGLTTRVTGSDTIQLPAGLSNANWTADVVYTCLATGSNGTFRVEGTITLQTPTGNQLFGIHQTSPAIDVETNIAQTFFLDALFWGSSGNTLTTNDYTVDYQPSGQVASAAAQLAVTSAPTTVVAGRTFSLTVAAHDAAGNSDPTYQGPITVALKNPPVGAILGGTLTVTATNGVATFNGLTLNQANQNYTLEFSGDGAIGALTAATAAIRTSNSWQNANQLDVDDNGVANDLDTQPVITQLKTVGNHVLSGAAPSGGPYVDVNGDGIMSPLDLLYLFNHAASQPAAAAALPAVTMTPAVVAANPTVPATVAADTVMAAWQSQQFSEIAARLATDASNDPAFGFKPRNSTASFGIR